MAFIKLSNDPLIQVIWKNVEEWFTFNLTLVLNYSIHIIHKVSDCYITNLIGYINYRKFKYYNKIIDVLFLINEIDSCRIPIFRFNEIWQEHPFDKYHKS